MTKPKFWLLFLLFLSVNIHPSIASAAATKAPTESNGYKYEYPEITRNPNLLYHGIPFDPVRFKGIWSKGLLTYANAKANGVEFSHNYGDSSGPAYNGPHSISLAQSPEAAKYSDPDGVLGAFGVFVKDSVSFVIDASNLPIVPRGRAWRTLGMGRTTKWMPLGDGDMVGVPGEVFANENIPVDQILGVMVPKAFIGQRLSNIPTGLNHMCTGLVSARVDQVIRSVKEETGYSENISEELQQAKHEFHETRQKDSYEWNAQQHAIQGLDQKLAQFIEKAYQHKLKKDVVSFEDILKLYLPKDRKLWVSDPSLESTQNSNEN